jgi:HpcH/HpaI aldolase/citrate lyase family
MQAETPMSSRDSRPLTLVLFEHDPIRARTFVRAGLRDLLVDWEWRGKALRQAGADTEILPAPFDAIAPLVAGGVRVHCRINPWGEWSREEVERATDAGAHRIYLPMAADRRSVERFVAAVGARAEAAIFIETQAGLDNLAAISAVRVDAVFVGLNDLAISRRTPCIFSALADGTVAKVRDFFPEAHFGFGGVTVLGRGSPIPCRRLLSEMALLRCDYAFLRRSFRRDILGRELEREIRRLATYWAALGRRSADRIERDRVALRTAIWNCERTLASARRP